MDKADEDVRCGEGRVNSSLANGKLGDKRNVKADEEGLSESTELHIEIWHERK